MTEIEVTDAALPAAFDGFRIVQISDLHNNEHGKNNRLLLESIERLRPDLIAITGDLVDSYRPDVAVAARFIRNAVKLAPVYYVGGNHEARIPREYRALKRQMGRAGVTVLEDEKTAVSRGDGTIGVYGLCDPYFSDKEEKHNAALIAQRLNELHIDPHGFSLLLTHRPELFGCYCDAGVNLALSGHAHGGQVRLPLIGGLYAPHQGIFPKYTSGLYTNGKTKMVVSKGLGNSRFRPRVNSRLEVISLTLKCK